MAVNTKVLPIKTSKGIADGMSLHWEGFGLLIIGAPKGFLACGIFDLAALDAFGKPAALVESYPDKPIGTLENMVTLKLMKVNSLGEGLGLKTGMPVTEALELLF